MNHPNIVLINAKKMITEIEQKNYFFNNSYKLLDTELIFKNIKSLLINLISYIETSDKEIAHLNQKLQKVENDLVKTQLELISYRNEEKKIKS